MNSSMEATCFAQIDQGQPPVIPAESSNTAGPNRHSGGIDTLEVSIYGNHTPLSLKNLYRLEQAKQAAQDNKTKLDSTISLEAGILLIDGAGAGKGSSYLDYRGRINGIQIAISAKTEKSESHRIAGVVIGSLELTYFGHDKIWQEVCAILRELGIKVTRTVVSRVDLCVDIPNVATEEFTKQFLNNQRVCRARDWSQHGNGDDSTGFDIGKDIHLRVYDKLTQIYKDQEYAKLSALIEKKWGCLPEQVTRVEFQIRRDSLQRLWSIHTVEELFAALATLSQYLPTEWFRLVDKVDRENGNQSRAKPSIIWNQVIEAFAVWPKVPVVQLKRKEKPVPNLEALALQGIGVLTSAASQNPDPIRSLDELLSFIKKLIQRYAPDWQTKYADKLLEYEASGKARYYGVSVSEHAADCFCQTCREDLP